VQVETRRMAASAGQYSAERRYPRHFLSAPVTTWQLLNSGPQVTRGLTLEISVGGLSAILCGPPLVGEGVSVRVQLFDSAFEAPAIVRHSRTGCTGFEFLDLPPEFLRSIEANIHRSLPCLWPRKGLQLI
jgi:PilZ domain